MCACGSEFIQTTFRHRACMPTQLPTHTSAGAPCWCNWQPRQACSWSDLFQCICHLLTSASRPPATAASGSNLAAATCHCGDAALATSSGLRAVRAHAAAFGCIAAGEDVLHRIASGSGWEVAAVRLVPSNRLVRARVLTLEGTSHTSARAAASGEEVVPGSVSDEAPEDHHRKRASTAIMFRRAAEGILYVRATAPAVLKDATAAWVPTSRKRDGPLMAEAMLAARSAGGAGTPKTCPVPVTIGYE
jgi:hypothetical protein